MSLSTVKKSKLVFSDKHVFSVCCSNRIKYTRSVVYSLQECSLDEVMLSPCTCPETYVFN